MTGGVYILYQLLMLRLYENRAMSDRFYNGWIYLTLFIFYNQFQGYTSYMAEIDDTYTQTGFWLTPKFLYWINWIDEN